MGGGTTSATDCGGAYCSFAATTTDVTHSYHRYPILTNIPREPFNPLSFGKMGLSCLCPVDSRRPYSTCAFGPAPTRMEVEAAMANLQRLMHDEAISDKHWLRQIVYPSDSGIILKPGYARLHGALSMLQTEPTVQNMVIDISSDKAFWDAITNNQAVQNLQTSISAERKTQLEMQESNEKESDIAKLILEWIIGMTKTKIGNVIEKIGAMMVELFFPSQKEKPTSELTDLVEEKIRSSFLLSVVIVLIVVVTRNNGA